MTGNKPADRPDLRSVNFCHGGPRSVDFIVGKSSLASFRTLKSRRQFLAVARTGRRSVKAGLILQMGDRHGERQLPGAAGPQIGFTVSRKVGNAVERNLVKRRFRALTRHLLAERADPARDYVLVGRRAAVKRPYSLLRQDLERALGDLERESAR